MSEPCNDVGPTGTLCIHAKGHEGFHRDANFVWSPGSPKPSDSESSVPAPRPSETPPMTVDYSTEPLTYEQEIHSLLYTARTWGRDLKAIFERDLASGKLTPREREVQLLCLANFRTDLARIDAAIPLAEARRSPSVPTATVNNETNVARAEADRNVREIVRHFNLTGCKIEGATLRAFILGVLEAVSPVPSSEEAANSDTDQSAGEIIVNRDEWYAAKQDAERWRAIRPTLSVDGDYTDGSGDSACPHVQWLTVDEEKVHRLATPTWDEMASMFPDNTKRANRPRSSSAEPAPPPFTPCGVKYGRWTCTLVAGHDGRHELHDQAGVVAWPQDAALSAKTSPVQEEATPTPCIKFFESGTGRFLRRCNRPAGHGGECGPTASPDDQQNDGAEELPTLSTCLPDGEPQPTQVKSAQLDNGSGLTSAGGESRLPHRFRFMSVNEATLDRYAKFDPLHDHTDFVAFRDAAAFAREILKLRESLSGSISERETLTAELEKFREWFQNAEQARAVAEASVERLTREKAAVQDELEGFKKGAEALVQQRDVEWERAKGARAEVVALKRVREQAIQDIEALPPECELISLVRMNDQAISKRAVLSILRGSNG